MHPTLDGNWFDKDGIADIELLLKEMEEAHVAAALAVGLGGIGSYEEEKYIDFVTSRSRALVPIAYLSPGTLRKETIRPRLTRISEMGYKGVKLHPRIGGFDFAETRLPYIVQAANDLNLRVLLCTYNYSRCYSKGLNIESLFELLSQIPDEEILLMHGGAVRILELAEICRHFPRAVIDLSFTFLKYEDSSIDLDLCFLFREFDRRIVLGSDFPEFKLTSMRSKFNRLVEALAEDKARRIAYKNLLSLFSGVNIA